MALASVTALSWRPLSPLRRPSSVHSSHAGAVKSAWIAAMPVSRFRTCWTSSSGCSLGNLILRNSLGSPFLDVRLKCSSSTLGQRRRRRRSEHGTVTTRAGMRLDPGGGGQGGIGRIIVNVALAGGLAYLTVTGKLGWVFDTLVSLWLLAVVVPVISFVALFWYAEREIVKGACPNCGQAFQVFEFAVKEKPSLCPYCSQPFKLDSEKQFVRDEPRFSNKRSNGFSDVFGGFRRDSSSNKEDPGGVIVDVEAEVVDRD